MTKSAIFLVALLLMGQAVFSEELNSTRFDTEKKWLIRYPSTWSELPLTKDEKLEAVRFKALSEDQKMGLQVLVFDTQEEGRANDFLRALESELGSKSKFPRDMETLNYLETRDMGAETGAIGFFVINTPEEEIGNITLVLTKNTTFYVITELFVPGIEKEKVSLLKHILASFKILSSI